MARPEAPTGEMSVDLKGQTALVTGASRGLGRAIALAFGKAGANVACVARSADKLKETVDAVVAAGGTAEAFTCDVNDGKSVDEVVDKVVARFGGLQILVNNAGITRDTLLPRMEDDQWDEVINTNLRARSCSRAPPAG
ncbi:MAG: SDR family NAD(P)-dependent oxidoreductase [Pirellulales bacterium]